MGTVVRIPVTPRSVEVAWPMGAPLSKLLLLSIVSTLGERLKQGTLTAEHQRLMGEILTDIAELGVRA